MWLEDDQSVGRVSLDKTAGRITSEKTCRHVSYPKVRISTLMIRSTQSLAVELRIYGATAG